MNKQAIIIIFLFIVSLMSHSMPAFAGVDLPWFTTYDCDEWNTYSDPNCNGLEASGGDPCEPQGYYEQITSDANMPSGGGGRGQRHWQGDGTNIQSGGTKIQFNSTVDEIWVRWYMRYALGYKMRSDSVGDKFLYFVDAGPWIQWKSFDVMNISTGTNYEGFANKGWDYVMRNGADDGDGHKLSDGQWHLYEIHLKTGSGDGIAQMWIDEELVLDHSNATLTVEGFIIGSNQKYPDNGECLPVDFDDFAINNTGYIGPFGGTSGAKSRLVQQDGGLSVMQADGGVTAQ